MINTPTVSGKPGQAPDRMDEGCRILDCGPAPGRTNYPNPTSPYYQMELDEIFKRGYTNYIRVGID